MILDLAALRTLVAAVELQGFGRAAVRLHRSAGAVSLQLRTLEERLGKSLFRKVGRQQELTEAGQTLVRFARRLLELNDEAVLATRGAGLAGSVRFGMPQDFADGWLPSTLARFTRAHPDIRIELLVERSSHLLERLDAGELDLALSFVAPRDSARAPLAALPVHWYAHAESTLRDGEPVPLLVLEQPCTFRNMAIDALDKAGRPWRITLSSGSVSAIWAAVGAGLGVTPRAAAHVPPDVGVVDQSWQLPALQPIQLHLVRDPLGADPVVDHLAELVADTVSERLRAS